MDGIPDTSRRYFGARHGRDGWPVPPVECRTAWAASARPLDNRGPIGMDAAQGVEHRLQAELG
ncbi:hypothetical protein GCM10011400_02810 [Paraburkholderia caffeinilytica]|uniref:Uncharacterized protein n=1 Tax=Paraburkholderia caffeinilytica TaxID=1761016 RepID=A0ABQ1L8S1_9BURK|nr:hypothetical protein GCM10011400_02810 [Paraburkholderia caffeinilytica]